MAQKLRVLVVGCGHMGGSHARAYHELPDNFAIVGLVARHSESTQKLNARLGSHYPVFKDYFTALAETKPDAVCISTYTESHAGYAIAALEAWERRDHAAVRATEAAALQLWRQRLVGRPGVTATITPDPTHNPLDRLLVALDPATARITAWDLADRLAAGPVPVIVRDHEIEQGFFFMDPCNLHPGEAEIVADRVADELERTQRVNDSIATDRAAREERRERSLLNWPD